MYLVCSLMWKKSLEKFKVCLLSIIKYLYYENMIVKKKIIRIMLVMCFLWYIMFLLWFKINSIKWWKFGFEFKDKYLYIYIVKIVEVIYCLV